ncbi:MAG TPA: hypothetical protein VGU71_01620 [Candidatus Dormibacteraeota bacterium]|nr:hypothetical protein [Candidatus Dormibacteraeota bacterium]
MQAVAELSRNVQLSTQEQRTSTEQVVLAIEHIAEGSRSVAETAQEIAAAAARQGMLAADLAGSRWVADVKYSPFGKNPPPVGGASWYIRLAVIRCGRHVRHTRVNGL